MAAAGVCMLLTDWAGTSPDTGRKNIKRCVPVLLCIFIAAMVLIVTKRSGAAGRCFVGRPVARSKNYSTLCGCLDAPLLFRGHLRSSPAVRCV